jgi:enoyl-CoA hydratase
MTYKTIQVETRENIGIITFNRPEVRNALSREMVNETRHAMEDFLLDETLKAVIFTGAGGKSFISGADISELRGRTVSDALLRINTGLCREIEQFSLPTLAAIDGYALGGGCELAMACDLRVASEASKFGQPEVGLGIIPGAGGTYRLVRLVGLGKARELVLTGRIFGAKEALEIGLINRIAGQESVLENAMELAREIARNSTLALKFAKMALNATHEMSSEMGMLFESTAQAVLFEDEEKNRRMTAFLDRKKTK